ncbi:MAG TPA: CDP-glucose 4,6-dehydratase [archaeon]|nr:CDP-glucose 4,6-dehydratase [archaeon]
MENLEIKYLDGDGNMLDDIYKGKKILLTGHTGFKGGWLSLWLDALGANVVGYSLDPPSEPNFYNAVGLSENLKHIHGDLRDFRKLCEVISENRPEMIFHLAAQALVRCSYQEPRYTYETNVMGTVNLLEAVRQSDCVRALVCVTSDKCYANREWIWGYRENDPMGGDDPYSSSKGCAELVVSAYTRSFFPPENYAKDHRVAVASARAGNVIGGGDWATDRLVPDCVSALSSGEKIRIRYKKAIRPWQYVLEPLYGYLLLGAKLWKNGTEFSGGWNFGPVDSDLWTVEELTREICRLWGEGDFFIDSLKQPHEANWLKLDCSKALIQLGWRPCYTVSRALEQTIQWYRNYYAGMSQKKLKEFTLGQINQYQVEKSKKDLEF